MAQRLGVVEEHEVRAIAGRDGADARERASRTREPVVTRDRPRRGAIRDLDGHALRDRRAHEMIDMALARDVERVAVVGAEADARRGREREQRRERIEILGDAALADPHRDAVAELLLRLAELGALVAVVIPAHA